MELVALQWVATLWSAARARGMLGAMTSPPRSKARRVRLAAIALCTALAATRSPAAPAHTPPAAYEIFALRYATVPQFPIHELVAGADTTRKLDIAMMFWLLEGPAGRRVLVDAGFYRQKFLDSWKPADFMRPCDVVQGFGVPPDSITDIIISHVHWDHLDGADLFPKANVWIQRAEYEYYVSAEGTPLHPAIDSLDAAMLLSISKAGRLKLVEGDAQQVLPGITAYLGGKHTYASQYLAVRMAKGTAVVASDNIYLYENLERHLAIAQTLDAKSNLAAQDRIKRLASNPRLIVPGHDPAVFTRFKPAGPRAAKIE